MELKDKVVFITGSSHGIGAASAIEFAKKDAKLILNGRKEDLDADLKEKLDNLSAQYTYVQADLTQVDFKEFAQKVWNIYGHIDVLVNNAGMTKDKMFIAMKEADFDQVMNLDLKVPFFLSKAILKKMNKQRSGSIINLASIVGMHGNMGQANYAAAKAGIIGFTKSLAKEAALRKIRVNAIAPGMIDTDMTRVLSDKVKENILSQIPLDRLGQADEVAKTAIFLAQNDYITGQVIVVDGGMTI